MKAREEPSLVQRVVRWWGVVRYGLPADFDRTEYLSLNPDVAAAGSNPARHFVKYGRKERRAWKRGLPRSFDPAEYLSLNPDVAAAKVDPVRHYLKYGRQEGRIWKRGLPRGFDPDAYLCLHPDVAKAGLDPVQHFIDFGRIEGRSWKIRSSSDPDSTTNFRQDSAKATRILGPDISWVGGALRADPILVGSHGSINIIAYMRRFWAVPQALGPVDFNDQRTLSHPNIISADTEKQLIARLDMTGVEANTAADEHSSGQPSPNSPQSSSSVSDALHEHARNIGLQRLFDEAVPALRNAATSPTNPAATRGVAAKAGPLPVDLGWDSFARFRRTEPGESPTGARESKNRPVPHTEIAEHSYAKVIGAQKLISVVIPYFCKGSTMLRCLEALRQQDYALCSREDIEIIIVDDGTPHETIHEKLPDDVHYIWQRKVQYGICRAKNTGAKLSNGRYIAFVDPDLEVGRRYFDSMLRVFTQFGDRIVQTGYILGYHFEGLPDPRTEFGVWENPGILTRRFYQVAGGNLAIARNLFDETPGFDEDLIYGGVEDLLFGYHVSQIPGTSVVFNREMDVHHIPHPPGGAHLNVRHTWEIVKRKWPEFHTDYVENGSR
jgi:Glycosyl transferase family 2